MSRIETNNVWNMFVSLFKNRPAERNVNMVTERTTDGESPAMTANDQSPKKITKNRIAFPILLLGNLLNKKLRNKTMNPTWSPETDRTCTAPAN